MIYEAVTFHKSKKNDTKGYLVRMPHSSCIPSSPLLSNIIKASVFLEQIAKNILLTHVGYS